MIQRNKLMNGGFLLLRHKIEEIHSDEVSKIFSFFKEEQYDTDLLDIKKEQLKDILKYAWENHQWDRVKASIDYLQFVDKFQIDGLESSYLFRMEKYPNDDYLIIKKDTELILINEEQGGIISAIVCPKDGKLELKCSNCQDKENLCLKWINSEEGGRKFRKVFQESYVPHLSQKIYDVFINPGKKICEAFDLK